VRRLRSPRLPAAHTHAANYLSKHMRERIQKAAEERRAYEKRYVKDKAKFKGMRRIDFLGDAVRHTVSCLPRPADRPRS
jgi:hypothetical protein